MRWKVRGESAFGSNADSGTDLGIDGVQGEPLSPEWTAIMEEECQKPFALLQDEKLQSMACYRLKGYSNLRSDFVGGVFRQKWKRRIPLSQTTIQNHHASPSHQKLQQ